METCLDYTTRECAYFSSDEQKFIRKIRKLKEKYPDEVRIIKEPEDNDGCIYCMIPIQWFTIKPPMKRVLTDEQKQEIADRLKASRRT